MAAGVRTIAIRFLGDTKGLDKAGREGEKAIGGWRDSFKKLDRVATGVLIGLGGAIAGAVTKMAMDGDKLAKESRKLGVGVESLQEMKFWADQAGVSQTELVRAVGRLNQRIGDGVTGKYVEKINELGVATLDAGGNIRQTEDVMRDTIESLRGIEDSSVRSQKAGEIFGTKLARDLGPALDSSALSMDEAAAKARELGIIMDAESVDASEDFMQALDDLKTAGAGLIRDFATPFLQILSEQVLPVIQDRVIPAVRRFGEFIDRNRGLVVTIAGVLLGLAAAIKTISVIIRVVTAIQWLWNIAMMANPIGLIIAGIIALIAVIVLIVMHWETVRDVFLAVWDRILDAFKAAGDWIRRTFWDNGLRRVFEAQMAVFNRVRDVFRNAFDRVKSVAQGVLDFFRSVPGRIRSAFSNLMSIITAPFRSAFNAVAGLWNRTVGRISFETPSWVPGFGGRGWSMPQIPTFHQGGTVPGRIGEEMLILAQGGETVRTPEQEAALGGDTHVTVVIDGRALDESLMRVSSRRDRSLKRRTLAGAGAAR